MDIKLIKRIIGFIILSTITMTFLGCSTIRLKGINKEDIDAKDYFYPYLSASQVESLDYYNAIGVMPGEVLVPAHDNSLLEGPLNADNMLQNDSIHGMTVLNKFIANQASSKLGCKQILKNKSFIISPGIYHFDEHTISIADTLKWQLNQSIKNVCRPDNVADLDQVVIKAKSPYWNLKFSAKEAIKQ